MCIIDRTDSEVFGFSQVNSEHCRHKIFNGTFIIDGLRQNDSLFAMIKQTSKENPNGIVSAYKDNVAFVKGPRVWQFAPTSATEPSLFTLRERNTVLALKAETHNFPTTVEPFNGAATGSGGEIRDRMCGGKGSLPLSGSAVYITSYPRLEKDQKLSPAKLDPRPWLYQSPQELSLIHISPISVVADLCVRPSSPERSLFCGRKRRSAPTQATSARQFHSSNAVTPISVGAELCVRLSSPERSLFCCLFYTSPQA